MAFQLVKLIGSPVNVNTNLNPLGEWDNSTNYVVADVVSYQGSSYICVADNNNTLPTDTAYWMVLAEAGANTVTVRNTTGSTLYKGTVVYINGASGNFPTVAKALATGDPTSAQTLGFVYADISNNSNGEVITEGNLYDLDTRTTATHPFTSDTLANGNQLYLSPDTAGYVTNVKPSAPDHLVYVGTVVNTGTSNGEILVKVMNGFELQELHNVAISSVADNDIIQYDSATSLWKNEVLNKSSVGLGNVDNTSDVNKPISTATQTALDGKVDENTAITGATKTKITYDSKGLVTAGADAAIADITGLQTALDGKLANVVEDTTPQLGGYLDITGYGFTIEATAGENLVAGNLCYLKSDGKYWKADNSAESTASTKLVIATETINANATGTLLTYGQFTTSGLNAGSNYFVGSTGGITATTPTTQDYVIRPIGTASSTTVLEFNPSVTWATYRA